MTICPHNYRMVYEPTSSLGDESDYRSRCTACGTVLRSLPNLSDESDRAEAIAQVFDKLHALTGAAKIFDCAAMAEAYRDAVKK